MTVSASQRGDGTAAEFAPCFPSAVPRSKRTNGGNLSRRNLFILRHRDRYETDCGYPEQKSSITCLIMFSFHGAYGHRRIIEMVLAAPLSTSEKSPCPVF
jgi:hypothetical protein